MKYIDALFGEVEINEPVILDLINSKTLQRLKKIDQAGFLTPFRPKEEKITRFEHSLGVYLLLKTFGASLPEQISGLIHDVSHTAFSHCADYLGSHEAQQKQTSQDDVFESFVQQSEIPSILERYGIDVEYVLDDAHFPLKETALPDLCADRIDYSLRTAIAVHLSSQTEVQAILQSLSTDGTRWIFRSLPEAQHYATLFSHLNKNHYSSLESATMFHTVGSVLRHSLDKGYLTYDDLYTWDAHVLETVEGHAPKDPLLQTLLDRMYKRVSYTHDSDNFHARVFCKSRVVDPLCYHDDKIERLSWFLDEWKSRLEEEMRPVSYCIRFGTTVFPLHQ